MRASGHAVSAVQAVQGNIQLIAYCKARDTFIAQPGAMSFDMVNSHRCPGVRQRRSHKLDMPLPARDHDASVAHSARHHKPHDICEGLEFAIHSRSHPGQDTVDNCMLKLGFHVEDGIIHTNAV